MIADINECKTEEHNCDADAKCLNTVGSFRCTCKLAGFIWNGTRITGTICVDRTARQKRELTMYVYIHLPKFFWKITLAKVKERKNRKRKDGEMRIRQNRNVFTF